MIKVLCVDDEQALLELCKDYLEKDKQLSVGTADSPLTALRMLKEEPFDAIVADYQMPGMSGLDLLKKLRAGGDDIPFILFTGKGREEVAIEALNSGADFYVQKGGDPKSQFLELTHKIKQAVRRSKAEEALQTSAETTQALMDSVTDALCLFDLNGKLLAVNDSFANAMGATKQAIIGRPIWEVMARRAAEKGMARTIDPDPRVLRAMEVMDTGKGATFVDSTMGGRSYQHIIKPIFGADGKVERLAMCTRDITEQLAAEAVLREEEERFRTFVMQSADAIIIFDEAGALSEANPVLTKALAATKRELEGERVWDLHYRLLPEGERTPEVLEGLKTRYMTALETGEAEWLGQILERDLSLPGAGLRHLQMVFSPIPSTKGFRLGVNIRDITTQKDAEMELAESDERYRQLFEQSSDGILIADEEGTVIDCNPNFERIYGGPRAAIIGRKTWEVRYDLEPPEARTEEGAEPLKRVVLGALRTGENPEMRRVVSVDILSRDGARKTLEAYAYPLRTKKGYHLAMLMRDVSGQKRMEETLRESEALFRSLVSSQGEGLAIVDAEEQLTFANPAAEEVFGAAPGTLVGHNIREYVDQAGWEKILEETGKRMQGMRSSYEVDIVRFDGERRTLHFTSTPRTDASGRYIGSVAVFWDATERTQMAEELRAANRKLGLLASITRHDILNQLTILLGYIDLQKDRAMDAKESATLDKMVHTTSIIREQIEFMGDYEEMGTIRPRWQSVKELVLALPQGGGLPRLELSDDAAGLQVYADPMLGKVFDNLFDNTLRHGGGATRVSVSSLMQGNDLEIVYEDDGHGVLPDEKESIFERGFGKHTGLGLFLSREVLNMTGITIRENGTPGKGARFEMRVPQGKYRLV